MKHIMIVGDGMADRPLAQIDGKTPIQAAETPAMDWIASNGRVGKLRNVPDGMEPGSDVAMMSILGYDPEKHYTGRGPLEAAGVGVDLERGDVAFRCNLITIEDGKITDYSGGHVSTEEAEKLLSEVEEACDELGEFHLGIDYRHLFVIRNSAEDVSDLVTVPPHDIVGQEVEENLVGPDGLEIAERMNEMILESMDILDDHPINSRRREDGKKPANSIWFWGQGEKPELESLEDRFGIKGAVISAVALVRGLGISAGMKSIDVPGATGYYDTNYENKADYALDALEDNDLILTHVEAPDEAGHAGDIEKKIEAIEDLDKRLLQRIIDNVPEEVAISIMADHPTPIEVRNHVPEPVPFAVYSPVSQPDDVENFDESSSSEGSFGEIKGHELLDLLMSI